MARSCDVHKDVRREGKTCPTVLRVTIQIESTLPPESGHEPAKTLQSSNEDGSPEPPREPPGVRGAKKNQKTALITAGFGDMFGARALCLQALAQKAQLDRAALFRRCWGLTET